MNIYCINLDSRPDKWNNMINMFSNITKFTLTRFSAIKHNHGWYGCSLSHVMCIKQNLKETDDFIIIFEDDNHIINIKTFEEDMINLLKWLSDNKDKWEIFNGNPRFYMKNPDIEMLDNNLKILNFKYFGQTTNFMIYNKKCINKYEQYLNDLNKLQDLYNLEIKQKYVIDKFIPRNFVCLTRIPYLSTQLDNYSDIENKQVSYNESILRSEKRILKILKY